MGNGSSIVGPGRIFMQYNPNIQIIGYKPKESGKNDTPGLVNQEDLEERINFPHIIGARKRMEKEVIFSHINANDSYPCWDMELVDHEDLGRTGRAGISVALDIAKEVSGKNLLVIGYDKIKRY